MIRWGIIGCGNVTEVKSGPAFSKVNNSSLHAVMRRNAEKAKDYAKRHSVQKWYDNASDLINDPAVNAIYIATPPSSHEKYTLESLQAGKPVYLEKPMALDAKSAQRIAEASKRTGVKLSIAHYRRQLPLFRKVKQLLDENRLGKVLAINLTLFQAHGAAQPLSSNWRLDPSVSGGGYFHDLAPHQLDLIYYFFKAPVIVKGVSLNQMGNYAADDAAACTMLFENGAVLNGAWCFSVDASQERDKCEIIGTDGALEFSIFVMDKLILRTNDREETMTFESLPHVQQPMIEQVVKYFSGDAPNPCSGDDGHTVMWMLDEITRK
jgi:predicted dehydrogenase